MFRIAHRTLGAAAALIFTLALAQLAVAQARVEEKVNIAVTGDITKLDADENTITIKSTNDEGVTYRVDGTATIMQGGQKLALADLKTGWNVAANGHRMGDIRTLTMIKVVKAP